MSIKELRKLQVIAQEKALGLVKKRRRGEISDDNLGNAMTSHARLHNLVDDATRVIRKIREREERGHID